jgi:hypothetical protein
MRRFVPTRPDVHARFVAICDRADAKHAAHLERLKARPAPRGSPKQRGVLGRRAAPPEARLSRA